MRIAALHCMWKAGWVLLLFSIAAHPQSPQATRIEALIDSQFPDSKCPGLSVAIAAGGEIFVSKALGSADIEQNVPLTIRSAHRLASLSKLVTGTIMMELVEAGRLKLDAPVRVYLPELPASYGK